MGRLAVAFASLIAATLPLMAAPPSSEATIPHFTWGADIGGAIDMSGHDMSTINIDAYFGYRGGAISILGIGAGINNPVNNSRREFPVYAIARTSFTQNPQPVFGELRTGIVVNSHPESNTTTDFYLSPGIGFKLACGRSFESYLTIGYIYNGLRTPRDASPETTDELSNPIRGVHSAVIRLGITF